MRARASFLILLLGVAIGVAGTIAVPRLAGRYLPVWGKTEIVQGEVVRKAREGDRLLLTVVTDRGNLLATLRRNVTEVDLLVETGDTLTLALRRYQPFVEDPVIQQVRKPQPQSQPEGGGTGR